MLILDGKRYHPKTADPIALGFAYHAENTINAMKRNGAVFIDRHDERKPDFVFHQAPAHVVDKIENLTNVLYTAYEAPDIPPNYVENAKKMDLILCVSNFVTKAFRKAVGKNIPIYTCNLGVDHEIFQYRKRKSSEVFNHTSPFVYLWTGAPNIRKGWDMVRDAWKRGGFFDKKDCCLYIKTSGRDKIESYGNVIMDSRRLPIENLVEIYHSANCFVFPSYSEGFGLTLAEAMSTGLPCIYTPWGGMKDFIDNKTGYPLRYKVVKVDYGIPTIGAEADIDDLVFKMNLVKSNYQKSVNVGKKASRKISSEFTWEHTGRNIMKILRNFLSYRRK